jgi:Domain of unknown function (DUF4189)
MVRDMGHRLAKCVGAVCGSIVGLCLFIPLANAADEYGALAFNDEGAWGYSINYADEPEARERALGECKKYGTGCRVARVFRNVCFTFARNEIRGRAHITWAEGMTKPEREQQTLNECRQRGGTDCKILGQYCTGNAQD